MTQHVTHRRARVFISCGQNKETNEIVIADKIRARLETLGFDRPYIAVEEQTLRGLRENIFRQLSSSEYFLFVDFKREKLGDSDHYRGSLFSHQELALASYLDIKVLAFREAGVKPDDGIMRFLQTNAIPFAEADRDLLPDIIESRVRKQWDPNWRNELVLERDASSDAHVRDLNNRLGRYFQIGVKNLHQEKIATNCYAYLEKATKLDPLSEIPLSTVELKWEGYLFPNAHILPDTTRRFDALRVMHDNPTDPHFLIFSDSTAFHPPIHGEGRFELRYVVVSDNFPPARGTFKLELRSSLSSTRLKPL